MATRKYGCNPQDANYQITEAVGSATTKRVEVTIDFGAMTTDGMNDALAKKEAINCLYKIAEWITKGNWPPA